jgi:hypothetical protein
MIQDKGFVKFGISTNELKEGGRMVSDPWSHQVKPNAESDPGSLSPYPSCGRWQFSFGERCSACGGATTPIAIGTQRRRFPALAGESVAIDQGNS